QPDSDLDSVAIGIPVTRSWGVVCCQYYCRLWLGSRSARSISLLSPDRLFIHHIFATGDRETIFSKRSSKGFPGCCAAFTNRTASLHHHCNNLRRGFWPICVWVYRNCSSDRLSFRVYYLQSALPHNPACLSYQL